MRRVHPSYGPRAVGRNGLRTAGRYAGRTACARAPASTTARGVACARTDRTFTVGVAKAARVRVNGLYNPRAAAGVVAEPERPAAPANPAAPSAATANAVQSCIRIFILSSMPNVAPPVAVTSPVRASQRRRFGRPNAVVFKKKSPACAYDTDKDPRCEQRELLTHCLTPSRRRGRENTLITDERGELRGGAPVDTPDRPGKNRCSSGGAGERRWP